MLRLFLLLAIFEFLGFVFILLKFLFEGQVFGLELVNMFPESLFAPSQGFHILIFVFDFFILLLQELNSLLDLLHLFLLFVLGEILQNLVHVYSIKLQFILQPSDLLLSVFDLLFKHLYL